MLIFCRKRVLRKKKSRVKGIMHLSSQRTYNSGWLSWVDPWFDATVSGFSLDRIDTFIGSKRGVGLEIRTPMSEMQNFTAFRKSC